MTELLTGRSADSTPKAQKCNHCARPGHASCGKRSYELVAAAVETCGRVTRKVSELIDQLALSVIGGNNGGSLAKRGICKGRLLQSISETSQVANPRRVYGYNLQSRMTGPASDLREEGK